jgi:hypothetical protein
MVINLIGSEQVRRSEKRKKSLMLFYSKVPKAAAKVSLFKCVKPRGTFLSS